MGLKRKAYQSLLEWRESHSVQALLVTGARQVGKTYLLKQFAEENFGNVVSFDLIDQRDVLSAIDLASNSKELFMALSAFAGEGMVPGDTVIFIDEVQESKDALTLIKYLTQREGFRYILSGSLLGIELNDLRSAPVGYLHVVDMFPLDFEEFCWANGVGEEAWREIEAAFREKRPVFQPIHERFLTLFHRYLVVGGMPQAVSKFIGTDNVAAMSAVQKDILTLYRADIAKYAARDKKLAIKEIFDQVPSQLDSQSKRFNFASVAPKGTYERYKESFLWLVDAGVAIPVRNVTEPKRPLKLSEDRSFFKLFMNDVGLLSASCELETIRGLLFEEADVNYGSIYENAIAQELVAHGIAARFFRSRKMGELDFVIEVGGKVVPLEVKSGKSYKRHSALANVLAAPNYGIESAIVLCEDNLQIDGKIAYVPIYMVSLLTRKPLGF